MVTVPINGLSLGLDIPSLIVASYSLPTKLHYYSITAWPILIVFFNNVMPEIDAL